MKLLMCMACFDIVKLRRRMRRCVCKKSSGRYLDQLLAMHSGPSILLGFSNPALISAIKEHLNSGGAGVGNPDFPMGRNLTAFIIPENADSVSRKGVIPTLHEAINMGPEAL